MYNSLNISGQFETYSFHCKIVRKIRDLPHLKKIYLYYCIPNTCILAFLECIEK
jgi:hypothetical protein